MENLKTEHMEIKEIVVSELTAINFNLKYGLGVEFIAH